MKTIRGMFLGAMLGIALGVMLFFLLIGVHAFSQYASTLEGELTCIQVVDFSLFLTVLKVLLGVGALGGTLYGGFREL